MKNIRLLTAGTFYSVLVFLSVSFLTVLFQIAPFEYYHAKNPYRMEIGFPFTYYEQFLLRGNHYLNFGWHSTHFIIDCLLTWLLVTGVYVFIRMKRSRQL